MITVTCTYADGDTVTTDFGGTREEARAYFLGKVFNIGTIDDNMQRCTGLTVHQPGGHWSDCAASCTVSHPTGHKGDAPTVPETGGRTTYYLADGGELVRCTVLTENGEGLHSIELDRLPGLREYMHDVPGDRICWVN